MKTLKKVSVELIEVETIPNYENMEFGKIYYSEKYAITNHLCLCGCGHQVPLPIKSNFWDLFKNSGKITITPSILQRFNCKSHYIITNGVANFV